MEYNGWKNKATWNIALWLNNDYGLYQSLRQYANTRHDRRPTYRGFVRWAGLEGAKTPDGFKYDGKGLDYRALTEMVREELEG